MDTTTANASGGVRWTGSCPDERGVTNLKMSKRIKKEVQCENSQIFALDYSSVFQYLDQEQGFVPCPFEGNFAPYAQSCTGAVPLTHGKVCPLAGKFRLFSGLRALDAALCPFALDATF